MKVLLITKTYWSEPPRIRHQLTKLLMKHNYEVTFIEKCNYYSLRIKKRTEDGILFFSHAELIHHQLRYFRFIQKANSWVIKQYLKNILNKIEFDLVINFSYDYSFLKELIGNKPVITVIEDDFESQAKFAMRRAIRNQVRATCQSSDLVLTVSYPILEKLLTYKNNAILFFPWSQKKYRPPILGLPRNTVLYFGFMGRLDWPIIESLIKSTTYHFRFIGPCNTRKEKRLIVKLQEQNNNFEYHSFSKLEELNIDDVFCSILPMDIKIESVRQTTVNNRVFNLLSLGLPIVFANLPRLIEAPTTVIRKNNTIAEYRVSLQFFFSNFNAVQNDIETFLKGHYEESRWQLISQEISRLATKY